MQINTGDKVASPYRRSPSIQAPYEGIVLSPNDPQAWIGTFAGERLKTQEEITAHVAHYEAHDRLDTTLPVLWNFNGKRQVFWEQRNSLVSYEAEVAEWLKARH